MDKGESIVQFRWWWNNIGNAFIDLGTNYVLNFIGKNKKWTIYQVSSSLLNLVLVQNMFSRKLSKKIPLRVRRKIPVRLRRAKIFRAGTGRETLPLAKDHLTILKYIDAKYYVFSGMLLDRYILNIIREEIITASKRGKIVLLGVGGEDYESDERFVREFLRKIKPYVMVTRDKIAYDLFGKIAEYAYNGIDMAFYVSKLYNPPKINEKYITFCFDKLPEPSINTQLKIIRLHHSLRPDLDRTVLKKYSSEENIFISDNPFDYLTLYSNAIETHSDRVHACVASLAYGVPCRIYYKSARSKLFYQLGLNPDDKMEIEKRALEEKLSTQLKFLNQVL